ncbi:C4-dicarboxylate transporter DcuC [uncultured Veillonella sp.]|uniref:C4-dicarboxylate transporter DcuC n=1 Tax=uncultured Veillonella sp. TaxID=159268 RepID=UPI002616E8D5|nr:C4-dicarboxylate transporter DcuC [uncultured Veillonella sp.]
MVIMGSIIVIATFYAIIKNFETRLVLIASGLLMGIIGGNLSGAINEFSKGLVNSSLTPIICITMAFSAVLETTGCSQHLVIVITRVLKRMRYIVIPMTVILVWFINISLMSAAGLAAAVGTILIPTLIKLGIKPAMAGSAVLLGTWGYSVSPGNPFITQVSDLSGVSNMDIIMDFAPYALIAVLVSAATLLIISIVTKENIFHAKEIRSEDMNHVSELDGGEGLGNAKETVNYLYAIIPLVPIVLLIISSPLFKLLPEISIVNSMLIGTLLCLVATRANISDFTKSFFKGMGNGFVNIICLIAAAGVFIQGMNSIGLTQALIDGMSQSVSLAKGSATFGPFILAAISGSGNAAILAFNGVVTPFAGNFGLTISDMGAVVQATGGIGRTLSPVAGVTLICANLAKVNPIELSKRNILPATMAAIVLMILILF